MCFKSFNNENALNDHIRTLKKIDENHYNFFNNVLDLINFEDEDKKIIDNETLKKDFYIKLNTEFGKIILRKKKNKLN